MRSVPDQAQLTADVFTASAIVHEVSNVLTPALLSIEACLTGNHSDQAKDALECAHRAIQQARDISETILNLNTNRTVSESTIFGELERELMLTWRLLEYSSASTLLINGVPDLAISMSQSALLGVISNLLSNALSVSQGTASLVVTAKIIENTPRWFHVEHSDKDSLVRITIADTGPGISDADLPYIFDTGYSNRAGGHGVGLALCKQLVEYSGGRIAVDSTAGLGTVFAILLPGQVSLR